MHEPKAISRLVVKFGTESLSSSMGETRELNQDIFNDFARQIIELHSVGIEVVIVSSGAIRAGEEQMRRLNFKIGCLEKKQIAGIGARHLMTKWGMAFERYRKEVAQIWVTFASLSHQGERESTKSSIANYLQEGIIPVINENDVLSDEEIRWMEQGISENDNLAQKVAFLIEADAVLFITSEKGVYRENPKKNPEAEIYPEIDCGHASFSFGGGFSSDGGTGGMEAKFKAASECARAGKKVAIAGCEDDMIIRFARDLPVGTRVR